MTACGLPGTQCGVLAGLRKSNENIAAARWPIEQKAWSRWRWSRSHRLCQLKQLDAVWQTHVGQCFKAHRECSRIWSLLDGLDGRPEAYRLAEYAPVISAAACDARKTTAPATSGGSPMRWRAATFSLSRRRSQARRAPKLRSRRANEGRRDRIDVDVVRTPLNGQALGQMCDTCAWSCNRPTQSAARQNAPCELILIIRPPPVSSSPCLRQDRRRGCP